ncbi:hypothetical protein [Mesobacillus jeotgali]|uniref:hypothetical protein n=1 Tax=Mesobacillus jeotgali TaxID=129985 RepID=UPI0009A7AB41|nr:hypothetical protein [Mesobacillus jeotgali]
MYVKIYSYRLKPNREEEYRDIQLRAEKIYSSFSDKQTLYLESKTDSLQRLEIHIYKNENSYSDAIQEIDTQQEIQLLYKSFLEVISSIEELTEEDYNQIIFK